MPIIESIFSFLVRVWIAIWNAPLLAFTCVLGAAALTLVIRKSLFRTAIPSSRPSGEAQQSDAAPQQQLAPVGPRRLTKEQKVAIARSALARGSTNYTLAIANDVASPNSGPYADDLTRVLGNLHRWHIIETTMPNPGHAPVCGLGLYVHNRNDLSPSEIILADIFQSAEVEFEMIEYGLVDADVGLVVS